MLKFPSDRRKELTNFLGNLIPTRYLLGFLSIFLSTSLFAQEEMDSLIVGDTLQFDRLDQAIQHFVGHPKLKNASVSFLAIDLQSGDTLAKHQAYKAMTCASTTKLYATASAFEILGPDYKPTSKLYYQGRIDRDSTLHGNLWIKGAADISMGSMYFPQDSIQKIFAQWANQLRVNGIKNIQGRIIGDGSDFGYEGVPEGWSHGDLGNYYGAGPNGLSIYDNILRYYFDTGAKNGAKTKLVKTFPETPELKFDNFIHSARITGDNSYIYGSPYDYNRYGKGNLPLNKSNFAVKGSLPDPELSFAREFRSYLLQHGYQNDASAQAYRLIKDSVEVNYEKYKLLATHTGKSVNDIAYWTNVKSVNVFAETLVSWIATEKTNYGITPNGVEYLLNYWDKKIYLEGINVKDGSGLSRSNMISAAHFCDLLRYMNGSKHAASFYITLPIAGVSGTLTNWCKNTISQGRVHAKSGTMSKIKSYAGYVESNSNKRIAFAIVVNNYSNSASEVSKLMEPILNALVRDY